MIENMGHSRLADFKGTPGWGALSKNDQSLFEAYLRRSETWTLTAFLRTIGREGAIDAASLRPPPAPAAGSPVPVPPPVAPVPIPYPIVSTKPAALDPAAGVTPPGHEELAAMREAADRDFKRKQRQLFGAGQSAAAAAGAGAAVSLTAQEIQTATMLGRQWSAANSGHGRDAHGSYASSSSPHTADRDRQRSEQAAIQREIDKALQRKHKTGNAFAN